MRYYVATQENCLLRVCKTPDAAKAACQQEYDSIFGALPGQITWKEPGFIGTYWAGREPGGISNGYFVTAVDGDD